MAQYRCVVANKKIVFQSRDIDIIGRHKVPIPSVSVTFNNHLLDTSKLKNGEEIEKLMDGLLTGIDANRWNKLIIKVDFNKTKIKQSLDTQIEKLKKRKKELEAARVNRGPVMEYDSVKVNLSNSTTEGDSLNGETKPNGNGGSQSDS